MRIEDKQPESRKRQVKKLDISQDIFTVAYDIINDLNEALYDLEMAGEEEALSDSKMRKEKAKAFLQTQGTVAEREAKSDYMWAEAREEAFLASARKETALEVVRSLRQQLSAIQSIISARKAEAEGVSFGHF